MNHSFDSQLNIIKNYYKNTINYHRHNTQKTNGQKDNNSFSLSDKKYYTKYTYLQDLKW